MKPRVHAFGSSAVRDSHAKCVRIYRRFGSLQVISCGFRPNLTMAPTLLVKWKGSGRNQPFTLGTMKRIVVAAENLCPAPADGGGLYCTESRSLPVAKWLSISFRPNIRSSIQVSSEPPPEILFDRKNRRFYREAVNGRGRRRNGMACLPHTRSATWNFLGHGIKKRLVRSRARVL
jgi:hypothetical protein